MAWTVRWHDVVDIQHLPAQSRIVLHCSTNRVVINDSSQAPARTMAYNADRNPLALVRTLHAQPREMRVMYARLASL